MIYIFIIIGVLVFTVCVAIAVFAVLIIKKKRYSFVDQSSPLLKEIRRLNKDTGFAEITGHHYYSVHCNSKSDYDSMRLFDILVKFVESELEPFRDEVEKADANAEKYKEYCNKFNEICQSGMSHELRKSFGYYRRTEESLCRAAKLHPRTNIHIIISKSYSDSEGHRIRHDKMNYYTKDIIRSFEVIEARKKRRYA